jgi:DNA-binding MarR family transcriptional regulator/predicted GNAT family N-acyltransferase
MEALMSAAEQIRKELRLLIREMGLLSHNCLNSGMTLAQVHILSYLNQNGITPFSELQLQLGIDKASLSRILTVLRRNQYITIYQDDLDRRAKNIELLPQGRQTMELADTAATSYIKNILRPYNHQSSELAEALKTIRLLVLRDNIIKQYERVKFERLSVNYYDTAIKFASDVFCLEQNIPEELVPVNSKHQPIWWCARVGEDIAATVASWSENGEWHWGRFAVDKRLRGLGLGKQIAISSLQDTFELGADHVYLDARDITVSLIKKLGGKTVGITTDFYGQSVTPMILTKGDFGRNISNNLECQTVV